MKVARYENKLNTDKKKARMRRKYIRRKHGKRLLALFLVLCVLAYCAAGYFALQFAAGLLEGKPTLDTEDFVGEESSLIFDGEGHLLTEIGTYYRQNIEYEDCPESLIDAFLAIEDSRFFTHFGIDIPRLAKAALEAAASGSLGAGGSTFTMQLVKNTYFTIDAGDDSTERVKGLPYKMQQIVLSMELETKLTKEEIFELYVNKLNFGGRVRGVQKAAQYYFGKNVTDLTLPESAMLAGIVNLPNQYNPYDYLDDATERRNEVLYQMLNHGYISEEEYRQAESVKVEDLLVGESALQVESTIYQEYVDVVIEEAIAMTGYDPVSKGMKIYTALVPAIQQEIEAIEKGETSISFTDDLMQTAIVTIDNTNGEIAGIGGGRNYGASGARGWNMAAHGMKQPGSSVKPILSYALAFEYLGYSTDEILVDKPATFPYESRVLVNATGEYEGDVTIKDAVANSLNIPAILTLEKVTSKIGSQAVVDYLNSIGISSASMDTYHMSYAIGGNDLLVTPVQLAGAHAAIVNGGIYNEPHTIRSIVMSDDTTYTPDSQNVLVLSSGSAYLACQLMQNNVDCGIYNYMQILKRSYPVYAKTGTSDWGQDGLPYNIPEGAAKDKWMVSSTSKYTNAVWLGYDTAVKDAGTYFPRWKSLLNIPGRINLALLDVEETVSPDDLSGVERPSDVEDVTYVYGTYPHVSAESWMSRSSLVTSMVSSTGLANQPNVSAEEYTSGTPVLDGITASITSGGLLYIHWITQQSGCSGGTRDISLHDDWNDIDLTGTCLVDTSWLFSSSNNKYVAEIYANGSYIGRVTSRSGSYTGMPASFSGNISVCGYYYNSKGTSEKYCDSAGYYNPSYYIQEEEEEETTPTEEENKASGEAVTAQ